MRRILGFTTLAGLLVGAATGAVFTPFGAGPGVFVGAVLGLLSGGCTLLLLRAEGGQVTPQTGRLLLTAPPLIVLALVAAGIGLYFATIGEGGGAGVIGMSVAVAAPLSVAVTWRAAPYALGRRMSAPATVLRSRTRKRPVSARTAMTNGLLVPVGFLAFAVVAWVVGALLVSLW